MFAGISNIGVSNWNWGSSHFRFHPEGWFGNKTGSGGTDKLGHFYTTFVMSDLLTAAIRRNSFLQNGAELTAATLALGLMFYVEIFDGYSGDHGFSREDMTMDLLGAGFRCCAIPCRDSKRRSIFAWSTCRRAMRGSTR